MCGRQSRGKFNFYNLLTMTVLSIEKESLETGVEGLQRFGRYHIIQYFWLCLPLFMVAMVHMNYVFIAEVPEYR